jgi:hypothetical protein
MQIRKKHKEVSVKFRAMNILDEFRTGIDLFMAGFGWRVAKLGYDPDDVLQEVYKGLLIRNNGKCPWDRTKASLGHYVHMVTGCILSNYTRKHERIKSRELIGMRGADGDYHDVAEILAGEIIYTADVGSGNITALDDIIKWILERTDLDDESTEALIRIVPLLIEGWSKREIAKEMGVGRKEIEGLLGVLRAVYEPCSVVQPKNLDAGIAGSSQVLVPAV